MSGSASVPLLDTDTPPLQSHSPAFLKVIEDVPHPNKDSTCAECDEDTDDHYHTHRDGPLVQIVTMATRLPCQCVSMCVCVC